MLCGFFLKPQEEGHSPQLQILEQDSTFFSRGLIAVWKAALRPIGSRIQLIRAPPPLGQSGLWHILHGSSEGPSRMELQSPSAETSTTYCKWSFIVISTPTVFKRQHVNKYTRCPLLVLKCVLCTMARTWRYQLRALDLPKFSNSNLMEHSLNWL